MKKSKQPLDKKFETLNYTLWRDHESYMQTKGLSAAIPLWWKFFEGDQWGQITENTKNIPRPVYNLTEMIVDNKRSNITGAPVAFNFSTSLNEKSTDRISKFDKFITKKIDQQELDRQATLDSLVAGTAIYYYYWNEHAIGPKGTQEGSLDAEVLDVLDFAVSNPRMKPTSFQKQKWVMVRKREEVKTVRAMVKDKKLHPYIQPDNIDVGEWDDAQPEIIDSGMVTIYIRFFRIEGEVYFTKETKSIILCEPTPLNPYVVYEMSKKIKRKDNRKEADAGLGYGKDNMEEYDIDGQVPSIQDGYLEEESEEEYKNNLSKFSLYPFVVDVLTPRKNCLYGRSEPEALMPNQKVINLMLAMIAYDTQQQAWSKIVTKDGALRGQTINNEPGQLIVDYTPGNQFGIQRLQGNPISTGVMNFITSLIETTRTMRNASEIFTGDMVTRDLSGTAIAQIQAQAQKPIDDMQKRQWRAQKDCAAIRLQFYKLYYDNQEFSYERTNAEVEEQKMAYTEFMQQNQESKNFDAGQYPPPTKNENMIFNGKDYLNTAFDIGVEAGIGTKYSEIMAADTLNTLFLNGGIQNMSSDVLEQYMTLMPESFMPFKADLRAIIKKQQMTENSKLKQAMGQMEQTMKQLADYAKALEIQLKTRQKYSEGLEKEFNGKISAANEIIKSYQSKTGIPTSQPGTTSGPAPAVGMGAQTDETVAEVAQAAGAV
jgi:hypothetical protein